MNKFRIVIETMGDGSERISVEEQLSRPALLLPSFLPPVQGWYGPKRWNTATFEIMRDVVGPTASDGYDYEKPIYFTSVDIAKAFIDAAIARRKARTVVGTRYEEYPQ